MEAKNIEEDIIWGFIVWEVVIAKIGIIAETEWVITSFEAEWVITALKRGIAYEMRNFLLLELEENIKGREETLPFLLYFLLDIRAKATFSVSGTSTAILISGEDVGTRSGPQIYFITSTKVEVSG